MKQERKNSMSTTMIKKSAYHLLLRQHYNKVWAIILFSDSEEKIEREREEEKEKTCITCRSNIKGG